LLNQSTAFNSNGLVRYRTQHFIKAFYHIFIPWYCVAHWVIFNQISSPCGHPLPAANK